jgi:hypothetical protein
VDRDAVGRILRILVAAATPPSWWPEFERQVAFYVAQRER